MRFITSTLFAVAALAGLVMSAENPIIYPDGSSKIVAGSPFVITWTPTTPGTVTLKLRQGPSDNLNDVEILAAGTANDGTFEWTPAKTLPAGTNYAIMIIDSQGNVNYTPLITIISDVPPTTTSAKTSSTASASSVSTTIKASSTATTKDISSTITSSAALTHAYTNTTTMVTSAIGGYSNATSTGTGNLTHSSSTRSSSPTSTEETAATATGAASGLLKSPLALVVCVLGAVLYLN